MSDQDYSSDGGNSTGSERNNKHHSYANSAKRRKSSNDNDYSSETSYEDYLFAALQKQAKKNRKAKQKKCLSRWLNPLNPAKSKISQRRRKTSTLRAAVLPEDTTMEAGTTTALLDSGSSASLIHATLVPKRYWHRVKQTSFETKGGTYTSRYKAAINIMLPELTTNRTIRWTFYVDESPESSFGMIIGSDCLEELGIDLCYSNKTITWGDASAPMQEKVRTDPEQKFEEILQSMNDEDDPTASRHVKEAAKRTNQILDAKYEKADIASIVENIKTLTTTQKGKLLKLLKKYEKLFDGTLGVFDCVRQRSSRYH
jgi:hypothetical protein